MNKTEFQQKPSGPKPMVFAFLTGLLLTSSSFSQSAEDYDAAIRRATERYRGDIPMQRQYFIESVSVPVRFSPDAHPLVFGMKPSSLLDSDRPLHLCLDVLSPLQ
jgi:hypothetical protein